MATMNEKIIIEFENGSEFSITVDDKTAISGIWEETYARGCYCCDYMSTKRITSKELFELLRNKGEYLRC